MQFHMSVAEAAKNFKFSLLESEDFGDESYISDNQGNTRLYDGQPAYRTNLIVTDISGDKPRQLTGTTVKIRRKPQGDKVEESLRVHLVGDLTITPWVDFRGSGQLRYSIIADTIATTPTATAKRGD